MFPSLNPGALRHPIKILAPSEVTYGAGGAVANMREAGSAMAAIETTRGTDRVKDGQGVSERYLTIKIWYQPWVTPNMQVQMESNGKVFLIQSIDNVREMNQVLILYCVALENR